jgi:hypothetical protein
MLITKQLSLDHFHNEAKKCICYKDVNKKMVKKALDAKQQFSRLHILSSIDFKKLSTPKAMLGCPVFAWRLSLNVTSQTDVETAYEPVLRIRIRDPVPFWPLDPGSGMSKKSGSGSGIRDEQPGSCLLKLRNQFWVKILKFFYVDPGWKKFGSGIGKNIPDLQHCDVLQY